MHKILLLAALFTFTTFPAFAADEAEKPDPGYGYNPQLPEPEKSLIPTVNVVQGIGWPEGQIPRPADGFKVNAFARELEHPRWLYILPNNDILVAETNSPPKPEDAKGLKGWAMTHVMGYAGAVTKSANRITLLRDEDGDGVAEVKSTFLSGLNSPFGMILVGNDFYVANTDSIMRFPYKDGETQITEPGEKIADLPAGPLNHHWTKSLTASPDGKFLYAGIGSNSNAGENGLDAEINRAAILQIERVTGKSRVFASGLRNPVGLAWNPVTNDLWVAVNERDELGDNLVPDYMTSVKDGAFYGWPYSYYGQHVDERVKPQNPDMVAKAIVPDYALGSHTASLGLAFNTGNLFPDRYKNGAFVGQHGSWNRRPRAGYKVIFIPFTDGQPSGMPEDILTGFISPDDKAWGRPVGVIFDNKGALLVADDVGNAIWRVTPN